MKQYMDLKEFSNASGISMSDIRTRLMENVEFRKTLRRFEDGRKFYVKTDEAFAVLDELLIKE